MHRDYQITDCNEELSRIKSEISLKARELTDNQRLMVCALLADNKDAAQSVRIFIAEALGFFEPPNLETPVLEAVRKIGSFKNNPVSGKTDLSKGFSFLKIMNQMDDLSTSANFISNMARVMA
jgi:hypothetical protein